MFEFTLGLIIGIAITLFLKRSAGSRTPETLINPEQVENKQENLERILTLVDKKNQITNDDVEDLLDVSNATAERYLDELEKDGKLKQVGDTGRGVYYKKA